MEVTSEAHDGNNEVDLTSQECTADTNNMNETNDVQNEETEQSIFLNSWSRFSTYILCVHCLIFYSHWRKYTRTFFIKC